MQLVSSRVLGLLLLPKIVAEPTCSVEEHRHSLLPQPSPEDPPVLFSCFHNNHKKYVISSPHRRPAYPSSRHTVTFYAAVLRPSMLTLQREPSSLFMQAFYGSEIFEISVRLIFLPASNLHLHHAYLQSFIHPNVAFHFEPYIILTNCRKHA
jgi:hypothetical protein